MPQPSYRQILLRKRFFGYQPLHQQNFSAGMVQDDARYLIPEQAVWDGVNVFIDQDGRLSKRGANKIVLTSNSVLIPMQNSIGIMKSSAADAITRGYVFEGAGDLYSFNPGSGTTALNFIDVGLAPSACGVPFQHQNILCQPYLNASSLPSMATSAGYDGAAGLFPSALAASAPAVTLGSNTITGFAAADITNLIRPGMFLLVSNVAAGTGTRGLYRVVSTGATTCVVEPTPTQTFVGVGVSCTIYPTYSAAGFTGCTFQNRLVMADVTIGTARQADTIVWSLLPQEAGFVIGTTPTAITYDGLFTLTAGLAGGAPGALNLIQGPYFNFVRVPELNRVVKLVPLQNSSMLILGETGCALLTGLLSTETVLNPVFSFTTRMVQQGIGCTAAGSVQNTVVGPMWTSNEGVMVYSPSGVVRNTMTGRMKSYWQTITAAGLTIYGSAQLYSSHYFLSTSAGGFLCNLDGFRWTRISGAGVDIWGSARDPSSDTRVYAIRANGQAVNDKTKLTRIDSFLNPDNTIQTDADGQAVTSSIQTRIFDGGDISVLKRIKRVRIEAALGTGGTLTATLTPGANAEETPITLGTISGNASATPQVLVARPEDTAVGPVMSHGFSFTLSQTGPCGTCDYMSIFHEARMLRPDRVT